MAKKRRNQSANVQFILFSYGGSCVQCIDPQAAKLDKQLRGVEMTLMAPGTVVGKYAGMAILPDRLGKGAKAAAGVRPVLKLRTAKGVQAIPVSLIQKLQFADAKLQAQLQEKVDALLASRAGAKTVTLGCLDRHGEPAVLAGAKAARGVILPIPKCPIEFEHVFRIDMQNPSAPAANAVYVVSDLKRPAVGCEFVVYESGRLAGRAAVAKLPGDACSLISYGVATDTEVQIAPLSERKVLQARIVDGKLQLQRAKVRGKTFVITNESDENMPFFAEYPRTPGRRLVEPQEWEDRTETLWRFRFHVYKQAVRTVAVREEEIARPQTLDLRKAPAGKLKALAEDKTVAPAVRSALAKVLDLKAAGEAAKLTKYLKGLNVE